MSEDLKKFDGPLGTVFPVGSISYKIRSVSVENGYICINGRERLRGTVDEARLLAHALLDAAEEL